MTLSNNARGSLLAIAGACSWGAMGVAGQDLLRGFHFSPLDLVSMRLLAAGVVMLAIAWLRSGAYVFTSLRDWRNFRDVLTAGVCIGLSQWTFFQAVYWSNVGTATVLATLSPLFMILWLAVSAKRPIVRREVLCMAVCLAGVALLVTKGNFSSLDFSLQGAFWSFCALVTFIIYTLQPKKVMMRIGVEITVGWAFFFGGLIFCTVDPPWSSPALWEGRAWADFAFIVLVGTVLALWAFLASTKWISPARSTLLCCANPVTAATLSWLLMGVTLNGWEIAGAVITVSGVLLLTLAKNPAAQS